ncbi:hypothetical protein WIW50_13420 [Flavobacteriaceae bacterium 3-367]|uniref:hypothetical protein n=1 Tax=Eudoraea algarum TaxID=3417568 RepID=UPI00326EBDDD
MIQNYPTYFFLVFIAFTVGIPPNTLVSQELKVFTLNDFDLRGKVKSCLVITDYGKEEFDFDENGFLTKLVTRYNDSDHDITYYIYDNGHLIEKRLENYRDGVFEKSTSIANFYEIDTTGGKKVTEKIYSYNKDFLDQYEYEFDADDQLIRVGRSNNDGIDETLISYTTYKGETTKTYFLNEVIQKSIRSSNKPIKGGGTQRILLTKEFFEGLPTKAVEQRFDSEDKLMREEHFEYDTKEKSFVPKSLVNYRYDQRGMLSKVTTKTGPMETVKEYIYQFDNEEGGNWIKQIITPENAYTTRRIAYYPPEEAEKKEE